MWNSLLLFTLIYFVQYGSAYDLYFCKNGTQKTKSCTTQILGQKLDTSTCQFEIFNDTECKGMKFGQLQFNRQIGGVSLKPYIISQTKDVKYTFYNHNFTVLNITFNNIKWKTMKFRFRTTNKYNSKNHCSNIVISNNVTINDRSILYYDCYWPLEEKQSHVLEFEASDDKYVNTGQFYFDVPTDRMLNKAVTERYWSPFVYIEMMDTMKLHIMRPPDHLKIKAYKVDVVNICETEICIVETKTIPLRNDSDEEVYNYSWLKNTGEHYFVVTPLHDGCTGNETECQSIESPRIEISGPNKNVETVSICIASVTALIVATLFAYYIALRVIRKYWCKDYHLTMNQDIPPPTKVLAIYPPNNRLHAKCVESFVAYLRTEYGLDVMYDGDISSTAHKNPRIWANDVFESASHVMYIVGPKDETCNNMYDGPVNIYRNLDLSLLNYIELARATRQPKDVINVRFQHSNGPLPNETKRDPVYVLLKDWHKLIAHLSKNLLPKKMLMRTEKGKSFINDLTSAKKLLIDSGMQNV